MILELVAPGVAKLVIDWVEDNQDPDDIMYLEADGEPIIGIKADGTVGYWPDGEQWVPLAWVGA